jgi:hypothetical protein
MVFSVGRAVRAFCPRPTSASQAREPDSPFGISLADSIDSVAASCGKFAAPIRLECACSCSLYIECLVLFLSSVYLSFGSKYLRQRTPNEVGTSPQRAFAA